MPVNGLPYVDVFAELRAEALDWLGDADFYDAHTHIGHNDPDGQEADPEELVAALDVAGQRRALVFPMHEPDGYRAANDAAAAAVAAYPDRLQWLGRVDPKADGALDEALRCLDGGARGIKLHPRSDAFGLPHPVVDAIVAAVAERRQVVLFHAGRGIPNLGDGARALAMRHPDVRIVLAHAGVSDLGLLAPQLAGVPNLLFDTSWWQVADLLTLFATVPPGQIVYASDMPYGVPHFAELALVRCARAVGLGPDVVREMAGGQLDRALAGEDLADLGSAPGTDALGPRVLGFERANAYIAAAVMGAFFGTLPTEALAMARLACQVAGEPPYAAELRQIDALIALAQERFAEFEPRDGERPYAAIFPVMAAQLVAGTVPPRG